jgi:membrane protease YdiL (CAAX protease family)
VANSLTALFFLGIHLPGWCFQGRLWDMLAHPIGGALSILGIGWALGLVAYKSKSVAGSTLAHVLNNLFNAS